MNANKLKIIVTASTYPRWEDDGVPMFVHDQLVFLKKNYPQIDITLLAPHHLGARKVEPSDFGTIRRFQYFYPARYQQLVYPAIMPNLRNNKWLYLQLPFFMFFQFIALLVLVLKNKPDYIYSHWFIPQGIVGGLVSLITATKHVYTSHSSDVIIAQKIPLLGPLLVRFLTKHSKKVTVVSQRSRAKLESFFSAQDWQLIESKIQIIPMGVDTTSFGKALASKNELKEKYGYKGRNILFFIGRLSEKKGVEYLLDALLQYQETDHSVLLVVAGDGPLMGSLKHKSENLGLTNVIDFIGYTSGIKKLELFKMGDVLILPSIIAEDGDAEGFPVVLMEGLASGKLCIATDVSGADDVLSSGQDGFLINQKSSDEILEALNTINSLSDEEKDSISKNAARKSKKFDWNNIVKQHVEHLFE
ncbi:putative glycosyltransferase [Shewanella benthica]|uniref:Putative glycosyltransferase n=1 Tax=Shewanella benthica TaxID=43661 RepID=A0A330M5W5_9GAMM|nr:glycosyltransferase family 4 protein [Shewanella benthica]SQH76833.1 putative glycosyltransferase [Shewanella benthica]